MLSLLLVACASSTNLPDPSAPRAPTATAPPSPAPVTRTLQLSFEAIPGNGFDIHGQVYDTSAATYEQKSAFTKDILTHVLPDVFAAVAIDPGSVTEELSLGGFQLQTSPCLQIRGQLTPESADDLAAALGWTTFQWSVLVTDLGDTDGGTSYATVHFGSPPDASLAQAFFEHAAGANEGLKGGYIAFGSDLTFLNLRTPAGEPFSGLDDATFVADLTRAAAAFTRAPVTVSASGEVGAHLVEDHWDGTGKNGEGYLVLLEDEDEAHLPPIREEYLGKLEAAASVYGWSKPAPHP